jgi:CHAT domain-containing protein
MYIQRAILSLCLLLGTNLVSLSPHGHSTILLAQTVATEAEISQGFEFVPDSGSDSGQDFQVDGDGLESLDELSRQAGEYHQQNYRRLEAYTLGRMGKKLAEQGQVELAIVFYKRGLNLVEAVRSDLRRVEALQQRLALEPVSLQDTLVNTFAEDIYRPLAALLLTQNRVWEAQQVLDLLKVQELDEFLENVEGGQSSSGGSSGGSSGQSSGERSFLGNPRFADRFNRPAQTSENREAGSTDSTIGANGGASEGGSSPNASSSSRFARANPVPSPAATESSAAREGIETWEAERTLGDEYDRLTARAIVEGQELLALRTIPPTARSPAQQERLAQLVHQEQRLNQQFTAFLQSGEVNALLDHLNQTARGETLNPQALNGLRDNLRRLDRAAILYPLILSDRLELVLTTAETPPIHRSVPVSAAELQTVLQQFRRALTNPAQADPRPLAQKLYGWLIQPLEPELTQAGTQTLIYAPDGWLRYIPLGALYDGQRWLTERYRINYITAQSLTDLNRVSARTIKLLAAGYTQGEYRVRTRQQEFTFSGLPFAELELQTLAAVIPQTQLVRNEAFAPDPLVPQLDDYTIVHFATHATFVSDIPEDSFIVFGNGEIVTLRDLEHWSLPHVDLVVLSACQTALGGKLGNGQEILGLGYQLQRTGARAAIASLWEVDDGGTQELMAAFYQDLVGHGSGKVTLTKAEALQQAQIQLIGGVGHSGSVSPVSREAQDPTTATDTGDRTIAPDRDFSHPYYWAPFILIGNGL